MKRFLSLVLTLVMVMSLVTVSAGAKDFTDGDKITYEEAVSVISTIGVVDGDTNGAFRPTDTLTRQAAAKIICNLILGPTTAAELHADTAPYKDVAVNNQFAGYIAYCQSRGIISGYKDGTFRPTGTLTGYAFMKMLLGALGYDSSLEGYVGENWSINVAKQALGIGLNKGLEGEFNGIKAVTREEACLYAFRTIQADLVEYGQRLTTNVNGTEVTLSAGGAKSREWNSQQSRYDYIRADNLIQFAEEYFNKLEKKKTTDDFERPSYTWIYDKEEIGTYVDWELMVEEYTAGVSGRTVYDLLGNATIRDNDLVYYVNGREPGEVVVNAPASANIQKKDLARSNDKDLGVTDNGVLTQIFVDKDADLITIASINTWLSQATGDYNESKEYAPLNVFLKDADGTGFNVDVEDVANVVDVKDEDYYLVNISFKSNDKGDVVAMSAPDIMEDSTVTKFSTTNSNVDGYPSKLTTGGTEYKKSAKAYYDAESLKTYYDSLLTNITYTIFMDPYGYFVGIEIYEGEKNYVFITGFDRIDSNLSIKTADAVGIFLDGTMNQFKVNVTDTDKNIDAVNYNGGARKSAADKSGNGSGYFVKWANSNDLTAMYGAQRNGAYAINRWFTYTVNDSGVYTLKPATRMNAELFTPADPSSTAAATIKTARVNITDNVQSTAAVAANKFKYTDTTRSYGNDDSVYLTVDLDVVDTTNNNSWAITDVNGVYTGVQNVEIEISNSAAAKKEAQVYTVYNAKNYIIGAVVIGEGNGSNANIVYRLSQTKSEEIKDGVYYWEFDAFNGEKTTLTVKSKDTMLRTQINTDPDCIMKLRYDADGYVVGYNEIPAAKLYTDFTQNNADDKDAYKILDDQKRNPEGITLPDVTLADGSTVHVYPTELTLAGNTLYVTSDRSKTGDVGLALRPDAKALTIQVENGSTEKTAFTSVKSAVNHLADANENVAGLQYTGDVIAALDGSGAALWVVFRNNTPLVTGHSGNVGDSNRVQVTYNSWGGAISAKGKATTTFDEAVAAILEKLRNDGYEVTWPSIDNTAKTMSLYTKDSSGNTRVFTYNHANVRDGGNFTTIEQESFDKVDDTATKLEETSKTGTVATIDGLPTGSDTFVNDDAFKKNATDAVKAALGNPSDVVIEAGTVTVADEDKPVAGTEKNPEGTPGEATVTVYVYEKGPDGKKIESTKRPVTVKITLAAKSYANSATAADREKVENALLSLPTSIPGYKDEVALDQEAVLTEIKKAAEELVKKAGVTGVTVTATLAKTLKPDGTEDTGDTTPTMAVIGTKAKPEGVTGSITAKVTVKRGDTELGTKRADVTLTTLAWEQTTAGKADAAEEAAKQELINKVKAMVPTVTVTPNSKLGNAVTVTTSEGKSDIVTNLALLNAKKNELGKNEDAVIHVMGNTLMPCVPVTFNCGTLPEGATVTDVKVMVNDSQDADVDKADSNKTIVSWIGLAEATVDGDTIGDYALRSGVPGKLEYTAIWTISVAGTTVEKTMTYTATRNVAAAS